MGSWDLTCHLTGIHIGVGDKVALIPMRLKADVYSNELDSMRLFGNTNILSNDGPNVYFEEATYPIFGEYADYGDMESIVKDDNTAILEKYFELPIEAIVTVLTDNRKSEVFYQPDMTSASSVLDMANPKHAELATYSITWIHGDVYSKLSKEKNTAGGWKEHISIGSPELLKEWGFTFEGEEKERERYKQKFTKGDLTVWSDGEWLQDPKNQSLMSFKNLEEYAKKAGIDIDTSEAANKTYYEQMYDYELRTYLEERIKHREVEKKYFDAVVNLPDEDPMRQAITALYYEKKISMFDSMTDGHSYMLLHKGYRFKKSPNTTKLLKHYKDHIIHKSFWHGETEDDIAAFHKNVEDKITALEVAQKANELPELAELYGEEIVKTVGALRSNITEWFTVKSFFQTTGRFLFPIGTSPQWGEPTATKVLLEAALEVVNAELKQQADWDAEDEEEE